MFMFLSFIFSRSDLNMVIFFVGWVIIPQYPLEIYFLSFRVYSMKKLLSILLSLFICFSIDPVQSLIVGLKFYSRSSYHLLSSLGTLETHVPGGFMMSSSYVDHLHILCLIVIYLVSQSYFILF